MGYYTEFFGEFEFDKKLDSKTYKLLHGLGTTRRMKRNVDPKYGVDGEFYVESTENFGQDKEDNILDYNKPPSTQPSLWCCWEIDEDRTTLHVPEVGKHYYYDRWLQYIINITKAKGYVLNGQVDWQGEDSEDMGRIIVKDNVIKVQAATVTYEDVDALLKEVKELRNEVAEYTLLIDTKKITKIKKLVALATSSNENESRSAIMKANELLNGIVYAE